jgi:hypothetical protein
MRAVFLVAALTMAIGGLACYPKHVSADCRKKIDDCLQACPDNPAASGSAVDPEGGGDTQTDCQHRCNDACK